MTTTTSAPMTTKILLSLCLATFGVLVPVLEIGPTHVFNPLWPEHARLHEVWQLITNCGFAALALWLTWVKHNVRMASGIALIIVGGFLGSFVTRSSYGGSMRHTDGTELTIGGANSAVLVMVVTATILGFIFWRNGKLVDQP